MLFLHTKTPGRRIRHRHLSACKPVLGAPGLSRRRRHARGHGSGCRGSPTLVIQLLLWRLPQSLLSATTNGLHWPHEPSMCLCLLLRTLTHTRAHKDRGHGAVEEPTAVDKRARARALQWRGKEQGNTVEGRRIEGFSALFASSSYPVWPNIA